MFMKKEQTRTLARLWAWLSCKLRSRHIWVIM